MAAKRPANNHVASHKRFSPDLADDLLTYFIQIAGLTAAIVFGVFAVLSWVEAREAKSQANKAMAQASTQAKTAIAESSSFAESANLLALVAICTQNLGEINGSTAVLQDSCASFLRRASPSLTEMMQSLAPSAIPTATSTSAPSGAPSGSSAASAQLSTEGKVILGVVFGVVLVIAVVTYLTWAKMRRKRQPE